MRDVRLAEPERLAGVAHQQAPALECVDHQTFQSPLQRMEPERAPQVPDVTLRPPAASLRRVAPEDATQLRRMQVAETSLADGMAAPEPHAALPSSLDRDEVETPSVRERALPWRLPL